jgi:hypothetical protein
MSFNLQIVHDASGTWSIHGLPGQPIAHLASLAASIDYARKECAEAPATIELIVDGSYAVLHQERGWGRHPCSIECGEQLGASALDAEGPPVSAGLRDWLRNWGKGT